ncbi:MAG TPA: hypothetical protein PKL83_01085 [bacterium]|nr:hypothetical protein [bacterium]
MKSKTTSQKRNQAGSSSRKKKTPAAATPLQSVQADLPGQSVVCRIIELLAQQEDIVRELYQVYAEKFPDYAYFWNDIAEEEMMHGRWIRALQASVREGDVICAETRFQAKAIETSMGYIRDKVQEAREEEFTMSHATSIAYDIEKSLLENKFFEVFASDSLAVKNTLQGLAKATQTHLEWTREMWAKFNKR